jgi:hypothetical protein
MNILDQLHWTIGLVSLADRFDDSGGAQTTDVVKCQSAEGVFFLIEKGAGATGTFLPVAQACSNAAAAATTDVAYWYRISTTPDTWSAWTHATTAGFTSTAGANQLYQIFVPASELAAAGYAYCRLSITEPADNPCIGCVLIAVVGPRYQPVPATLLT